MNIAIIGAGAIGSVVAAYLTKAGEDVLLVGREDQVEAVSKNGLKITGVRGDETIQVKTATQLDREYDLVIFATKTQDLEAAYQHNHEYLENCYVLTSQNGVQADSILGVHFEREKMLSSIVMFGSTYVKPGEITFNFEGSWIVGKPYTPVDPKAHEIADLLGKAFPITLTNDIMGMKYLKLFVNFNNCIPALIGKSMQETFADMDLCRLSILLLREGIGIINKANVKLVSLPDFPTDRIYGLTAMPVEQAAGIIHKTLTTLSDKPLYGSILQSIMRGKASEIDFINGEVVLISSQIR
ncbi:MAG: ketopantoate reductase family protein, partial [Candidatus Omnitrophica bacterium]|nr:ketopantoate reductase family protein [Candidatus Omnitrophota bacterium]